MRQLYIACICSIADYGVPIWWSGQKSFLEKYQKLQNQALLKILGAFKGSPIRAMEIEASLPPPEIRFMKICRNYAFRAIFFQENHIIKSRLPETFFLNPGSLKVDTSKFLDWNSRPKTRASTRINIRNRKDRVNSSPNSRPSIRPNISPRRQRDPDYKAKRRKWTYPTQLIRVISLLAFQPWKGPFLRPNQAIRGDQDLNRIIDLSISDQSKELQSITHKNMISQWVREAMEIGQIEERIIIYSDGSQSEKGYNGAGIFLTNSSFTDQESQAWNLGTECEVYDAELFAIYKALQISYKKLKLGSQIFDIWIFSDSQSAIQRLKDSLKKLNLALYEKIYKKIQKIRKKAINIHIHWVPGHMGIYGNEKADEAAKYRAD